MNVHDLLTSVRKHWLTIVALTVFATVAMGVLSRMTTPVYRATASLYFSVTGSNSATDLNQGGTYMLDQMSSYAALATKPIVLDRVIEDLDLNLSAAQLDALVTAITPPKTVILDIVVTGAEPNRAAAIANSVAKNLTNVVDETAPKKANDEAIIAAITTKPATPPLAPFAPNIPRNLMAGFAIGLVGGVALAYFRDILDTRIRRSEDIDALLGVPVLAKISSRQRHDSSEILGPAWNSSSLAEEFRKFRTNLEYLDVGQDEFAIVISSALPLEGKTVTCAGLGEVLAEAGKRVLIIDADLRRPRLATYFGLTSDVGLTTVLIGRAALEDVVQPVSENLDILASGSIPPNPSELLASPAMRTLLGIAKSRYDILLLDAPPLLPVADAVVLSRITAGVIIVADVKRVNAMELREAATSVTVGGGVVRGVVLNRIKPERASSSYQYETFSGAGSRRPSRRRAPVVDPYGVPVMGQGAPPAVPWDRVGRGR